MATAQVHSFQLSPEESLHSLQKRIEAETKIEVVNQELLQETGVSLDPRKPAAQCVLDGVVSKNLADPESCFFLLCVCLLDGSLVKWFELEFFFYLFCC